MKNISTNVYRYLPIRKTSLYVWYNGIWSVYGPFVVTHLNWTPILLVVYIARHASEKGNNSKDACYNQIGLTIQHSEVQFFFFLWCGRLETLQVRSNAPNIDMLSSPTFQLLHSSKKFTSSTYMFLKGNNQTPNYTLKMLRIGGKLLSTCFHLQVLTHDTSIYMSQHMIEGDTHA